MKILVSVGIVLVVLVALAVLYYTPGSPSAYQPFEEISDGLRARVPDERLPAVLDRVEAVLRAQNIPYRRVDARTLRFTPPVPPEKIAEIEKLAGLRRK